MEKPKIEVYFESGRTTIDTSVVITHKGRKYNEKDLIKIGQDLSKKHVPKNQNLEDGKFNPNKKLSKSKLEEIEKWKKGMEASSWKSRQRSLRRAGKLEQYKIDMLNKLGMIWNIKADDWEKNYKIFRRYGLCDEIEDWVKEQRKLFIKKELSAENLYRLEFAEFSFISDGKEEFPFTWPSLEFLEEKLRRKKRKIELKLIKNPPKKLTKNQKSIIQREKWIKEQKGINQQNNISTYYNKKRNIRSDVNELASELNIDEAKKIIAKIKSGESMYHDNLKKYFDDLISKKTFGFMNNSFIKLDIKQLSIELSRSDQYNELSVFNTKNIDSEIRKYACNEMLGYYDDIANDQTKIFPPLSYLIRHYTLEQSNKGILGLKKYIQQYPFLIELHNEKIEKALMKLSNPI